MTFLLRLDDDDKQELLKDGNHAHPKAPSCTLGIYLCVCVQQISQDYYDMPEQLPHGNRDIVPPQI